MTDDALKVGLQALWQEELLRMYNERQVAGRSAVGNLLYTSAPRPRLDGAPIKTAEEEKPMGELTELHGNQNLIKKARDAAVDWCDGLGTSDLGPLLVRLADALEAAEARERKWQPFETAPEDGSYVLVWRKDAGVFTARYCEADADFTEVDFCWFSVGGEDLTGLLPTHWMPLPAAPDEA